MSNLGPVRRRQPLLPAAPPGHPIAAYRTYADAQKAVDYLSDQKFAVRNVSIVGTDLKMVERVTGRLTFGRVALAGGLSGAYFGGFVGLLLGLFSDSGLGSVLIPAMLIGVAFGIIFGVLSFAATGGRRDFTSTSQIVAAQYAIWCTDEHAGEAIQVLGGLDIGLGTMTPAPAAPAVEVPQEPVTGPTYSEMLAKQKAEKAAEAARGEQPPLS